MFMSGAVTGMEDCTMMNAVRREWLKIPLALKQVRPVSCVVAAGAAVRGAVGRLIGTTTPPTSGTASLASAWFSSRSQLAAHVGFAF